MKEYYKNNPFTYEHKKKISESSKNVIKSKKWCLNLSMVQQKKLFFKTTEDLVSFMSKCDNLLKAGYKWKDIYSILGSTSAWYIYNRIKNGKHNLQKFSESKINEKEGK